MSKRDELHQLPLFQKAEQIFKITQGLIEIAPNWCSSATSTYENQ